MQDKVYVVTVNFDDIELSLTLTFAVFIGVILYFIACFSTPVEQDATVHKSVGGRRVWLWPELDMCNVSHSEEKSFMTSCLILDFQYMQTTIRLLI